MPSTGIEIKNRNGQILSAKLEFPADQKPNLYALFAHCFTCSKNQNAIKHITRSLNQSGIAVMSFDFTGLGQSEGDFEDTNFSSNIEDLIDVANFMEAKNQTPELIIGHSLGGAAVIVASSLIPTINAIATIGAPSNPTHVTHLFDSGIDEIKTSGAANVSIGGRPFRVNEQFLDDISDKNITETLKANRKPILILHSPIDQTVSVDNARELFVAAHHPKSFISLDSADHLLSKKEDSEYAGQVIANWASRYIRKETEHNELQSAHQVAVRVGLDGYTTEIKAGRHHLIADEPTNVGGNDLGATPYDLLLASLGACTAMTIKMYAERKKWSLDEVTVELNHSKDYASDCETCEENKSKIDLIKRQIHVSGELDEIQQARLLEIADKCPVHKTLHGEVKVETRLV